MGTLLNVSKVGTIQVQLFQKDTVVRIPKINSLIRRVVGRRWLDRRKCISRWQEDNELFVNLRAASDASHDLISEAEMPKL